MRIDRNPHNKINFCHISPTKHLKRATDRNGAHLLLAHLVETDPEYVDFYANLNDGKVKILDNSAFEMFKQGRDMYPSEKLIEMGNKVKADIIVMSDYPKQDWTVTRDKAVEMIPKLKAAGFGTFYVPQSNLDDIDGLVNSFEWALNNEDIDLIGISILACPVAFGLNESHDGERSDAYKLQRFLSRFRILNILADYNLLEGDKAIKRFHCLGMTDGPNEVELLAYSGYRPYIYSWDSSAAVWAGLNSIIFDNSPTGLLNGKFEVEVDFGFDGEYNDNEIDYNIEVINAQL